MRALLAVLIAFLTLFASPAAAQERIQSFHSNLDIEEDGTLTVTETIRVMVEGRQIRRGIFRDLPTRYELPNGGNAKVGFTFLDASLDGRDVPTKLERMSNGVRIRIGDPDVLVSHGSHAYRIRYSVRRAVGHFEDKPMDELWWNVTGDGWAFRIDKASATIRLPQNARFGELIGYTGEYGSTEQAARVVRNEPGNAKIETTRTLRPREGFSIVATFPKNIVEPPTEQERLARTIADYAPPVAAFFGLLLVIAYYVWAYVHVGRDPRPGTIVPLFAPPDGITPAAIRYAIKRKMDHRGFAAALVDAGVRGHVTLEQDGGGFLSKGKMKIRRNSLDARQPLDPAEERMLSKLVASGETLEMDNENHSKFSKALGTLDKHYKKIFEGKAFHRNYGWAFAGLLTLIGALALVAAAIVWSEDLVSPLIPMITVALLLIAVLLMAGAPDKGQPGRKLILGLGIFAALIAGVMSLGMLPMAFVGGGAVMIMLVLLPATIIVISGFIWLDAPTASGRALLDRIAGFKQYLSTTEGKRFDRMQRPGEDLSLFERYLPYAIALGVENQWAEKFESALAAAAKDPTRDQGFTWYSGSHDVWHNPTGFTTAVGASLASSISSASTAPGSSSGSGGGGFSGGGGGGGGGGGW
ncbi:DUF2207 domain-containing protein [Sphingomicrobium clamense]|uniref:DUF2207 domain-containing protein n=1 Tax=Sphingomicrobium clamense TaxID=2851013 RepID=A0ABS6V7M8_9SPHN|nr:DUF2207 domain-containing protein [Sphingomicrobium sp. B8]MBW0145177.1 DUF2207 domain-containing protein [Sphingomicrobium sp. B8]